MMKNSPFFSIVIPVYNMAKWVGESLDSVLCQDFNDYEIICVNDGSSDNSMEILNSYAAKDDRIRIIDRENGGVSTARNCGVCFSQGQYIFQLDSDDLMCKGILTKAYNAIVENDYPDMLQASHIELKNGVNKYVDRPYPGDKYYSPDISKDERAVRLWLDRHIMPFTGTRFLKKEFLFKHALMFSPRYTVLEDGEFAVTLYRKADTIAYINEYSYVYCQSRDPDTEKRTAYRTFKSITIRWDDLYHDFEFWNLSDECRKLVEAERLTFIYESRDRVIMSLDHVTTKQEYLRIVNMLDKYVGKEIKQLPLPKGRNGIIFALARIIGIPKTASLLYDYLHLRKIK